MHAKRFFLSASILAGFVTLIFPMGEAQIRTNTAEALVPVPGSTEIPTATETSIVENAPTVDSPVEIAPVASSAAPKNVSRPVRLKIPSIHLDASIIPVGLNAKGEMGVPSGSSSDVGWYSKGARPGEIGSSVLDAHVFAAFENLQYVPVGADIYVEDANGATLHFVVEDSRVYALGLLSPELLFNRKDARRLNLITCAGKPSADGSTYTHRLVVYTKFVDAR
ncbi:class F sortase [Candidatus Kaiserbacteria bacterium]|nr:class F sortase [Candidatus Kaiserbacteria bacterium]